MAITRPIPPRKVVASIDASQIEEILSDLLKEAKNMQLQVMRASLSRMRTLLPGVRDENRIVLNTVLSVEEGLASGEIGPQRARRDMVEAVENYATKVRAMIQSLVTPSQEEEARQGELLDLALHQARGKIQEFEKHRAEVMSQVKRSGIAVVTAPVLAITAPVLDVAKLKNNGFTATSLEGYPVLHKQTVLGLSVEALHRLSGGDGLKEVKLSDGTSTRSLKPERRDEIKEEVIATFLAKNPGFIQTGREHSMDGVSWFWFLPENHIKLMKRCTLSPTTVQSLTVKDWGFPFPGGSK